MALQRPVPAFLDPGFGRIPREEVYARKQKRPTVLIADDEPLVRELLTVALQARGFKVAVASNGHQAIEACQGRDGIDVALIDQHMPGIKGLDTIAVMRRQAPWMRFCLMSGDVCGCLAQDLGATQFIAKPLALDHLASVLQRLAVSPLPCNN
jgi:DNA-binding NtrC family response regulator